MIYDETFLVKRKQEIEKFLHFLQECKYSGTWDTKVDFNQVIKTITQSNFIIDEMAKEIKKLLEEKKEMNKPKKLIGDEKVESILPE